MIDRQMVRRVLIVLLAISGLAVGSQALAQPAEAEVSEAAQREARELFLRGDRLYAEGRYEESVEAFQRSYDLSGRPELLFNLANAYERLGKLDAALAALREYAPYAPAYDRETIESRLLAIQTRIHEQEQQRAAEARRTGSRAAEDEDQGPDLTAPIIMLGAGGAAATTAVVFAVLASSAGSDASEKCLAGGLCPASAQSDLDNEATFATAADVSGAIGAALLAGGIVWMVDALSDEEAPAPTARLSPLLGLQTVGAEGAIAF